MVKMPVELLVMSKVVLGMALDFKLMKLVEEKFKDACMSDVEFAEFANKELGTNRINDTHIITRRKALNIPSYTKTKIAERTRTIVERVTALEEDFKVLREQLKELLP